MNTREGEEDKSVRIMHGITRERLGGRPRLRYLRILHVCSRCRQEIDALIRVASVYTVCRLPSMLGARHPPFHNVLASELVNKPPGDSAVCN